MAKKKTPEQAEGAVPSQIDLFAALGRELDRQGFRKIESRHINACIAAANLILAEFQIPHRRAEAGMGLAKWSMSHATGISSRAMARTLAPLAGLSPILVHDDGMDRSNNHPHDPGDFGRCIDLLAAVPELREHVPHMAEVSASWAALIAVWDELVALYQEELPTRKAPKLFARMQAILVPIDYPLQYGTHRCADCDHRFTPGTSRNNACKDPRCTCAADHNTVPA